MFRASVGLQTKGFRRRFMRPRAHAVILLDDGIVPNRRFAIVAVSENPGPTGDTGPATENPVQPRGHRLLRYNSRDAADSVRSTTKEIPAQLQSLYRTKFHFLRPATASSSACLSPEIWFDDQQK